MGLCSARKGYLGHACPLLGIWRRERCCFKVFQCLCAGRAKNLSLWESKTTVHNLCIQKCNVISDLRLRESPNDASWVQMFLAGGSTAPWEMGGEGEGGWSHWPPTAEGISRISDSHLMSWTSQAEQKCNYANSVTRSSVNEHF